MKNSYLFPFQHMPCALGQGYIQDCRDSNGGARAFYIIEFDNVKTVITTAGVITALAKATGKRFWKYVPAKETSYAKETINSNVQNGSLYYSVELMMALNKMQTNSRNEILLLAQNRLVVVAEDGNGKKWAYGLKNGLDVTAGEAGTGTAPADRNGYSLTLTGNEPALAMEVDDATTATLETPGV
jgi:hypothetical protein